MSIKKVGVIGRHGTPQIQDSLEATIKFLRSHAIEAVISKNTSDIVSVDDDLVGDIRDLSTCDLLIVVGGDGSILGVARQFAATQTPVIGVNRGGLGFLADISPNEIEEGLLAVLAGNYREEEHFLLSMSLERAGKHIANSPALNDIVVNSGSLSRMMNLSLHIDDEFVYELRADGLIVSTPTGSTAYALSAGGPIMHPDLDAIVIVPMFPHTLTSRPIVVRGNAQIKITVGDLSVPAQASADSQVNVNLQSGDTVRIQKYAHSLNLIHPLTHSFYEACRSKLDWTTRIGSRLR